MTLTVEVNTSEGGVVDYEYNPDDGAGGTRRLSTGITITDPSGTADSVSPSSVSPVVRTDLAIQLSASYPTITDLSEYEVWVVGVSDPDFYIVLNIVSFDDGAK